MNELLALREKRARLWFAARCFYDANVRKDGTLSGRDAALYQHMQDRIKTCEEKIERLTRNSHACE